MARSSTPSPIDGEVHAGAALSEPVRDGVFPNPADVLVMPSLDAANIPSRTIREPGREVALGPDPMGMRRPVHIGTEAMTVLALVNLAAIAAMDAIDFKGGQGGVVALDLAPDDPSQE